MIQKNTILNSICFFLSLSSPLFLKHLFQTPRFFDHTLPPVESNQTYSNTFIIRSLPFARSPPWREPPASRFHNFSLADSNQSLTSASAVTGPNRSTFTHITVALIQQTLTPPAPRSSERAEGGNLGQRGTPLQEADLQKVVAVVVVIVAVAVLVVRRPQAYWPAQEHGNDAEVQNRSHRNLMSTKKTERETHGCLPPFFFLNSHLTYFYFLSNVNHWFHFVRSSSLRVFQGDDDSTGRLLRRRQLRSSTAAGLQLQREAGIIVVDRSEGLVGRCGLFSFGCPRADETSMVGSEIQC